MGKLTLPGGCLFSPCLSSRQDFDALPAASHYSPRWGRGRASLSSPGQMTGYKIAEATASPSFTCLALAAASPYQPRHAPCRWPGFIHLALTRLAPDVASTGLHSSPPGGGPGPGLWPDFTRYVLAAARLHPSSCRTFHGRSSSSLSSTMKWPAAGLHLPHPRRSKWAFACHASVASPGPNPAEY